ncbi:unnamed protein product [Rangifer tarandus platyrhynchus]|uniref:Uncharacterized protein n=1 Tax=Rangifer tarandus platyrhynchus TaxID=3082113 RepID=A0ABN8ZXQ5_RANTA|nr:unnamed protein product [Rangifer tarandus platyrhynchus]
MVGAGGLGPHSFRSSAKSKPKGGFSWTPGDREGLTRETEHRHRRTTAGRLRQGPSGEASTVSPFPPGPGAPGLLLGEEQAEEEERNVALAAPSEERYPSPLLKLCSTKGLTSETPQASTRAPQKEEPHPEVTATPPGGPPSWWGVSEKTRVCTTETPQSGVQTGLPKQPPAQLKRQPLTHLVGTSGGKEMTPEDCCSACQAADAHHFLKLWPEEECDACALDQRRTSNHRQGLVAAACSPSP